MDTISHFLIEKKMGWSDAYQRISNPIVTIIKKALNLFGEEPYV
ncbi:hypothetical protein HMPREF9373_1096 [Psychrobacter sp. 1501(2011)]|nr:hypothetical protein HMPREF9373_1096 [Psychrobacter sp. 1501(2011)]